MPEKIDIQLEDDSLEFDEGEVPSILWHLVDVYASLDSIDGGMHEKGGKKIVEWKNKLFKCIDYYMKFLPE